MRWLYQFYRYILHNHYLVLYMVVISIVVVIIVHLFTSYISYIIYIIHHVSYINHSYDVINIAILIINQTIMTTSIHLASIMTSSSNLSSLSCYNLLIFLYYHDIIYSRRYFSISYWTRRNRNGW